MNWSAAWSITKDVVFTGTGVFCILFEVFQAHPSGLVLGTGLVLTVPATADHLRALLPSVGERPQPSGDGSSSPSPPRPGPQPSASSPRAGSGGAGE